MPAVKSHRRSIADAYRRARPHAWRGVVFTQSGDYVILRPGESPMPDDVYVAPGELQYFHPRDIVRLLNDRRSQLGGS